MNTSPQPLVLVTGGTGKTGRRIIQRLTARGLAVRCGSRSATPAFDWNDASTWSAALADVTSVYIAYSPDITMPGAVDIVREFCDAATAAGVEQLVLLAGRGEEEAEASESIVRASGARWTIVRASWFAQNFSEDFLYDSVLAGEILLPAGDHGEPFVDVDDIADVAVAAIADGGHDARTYDVTGPRLLTFAEAARELSAATGRQITYSDVAPADYLQAAIEQGVPEPLAQALTALFPRVLDGRNAHLGNGVREALGRPPRDFTDYARTVAADGTWAPHNSWSSR